MPLTPLEETEAVVHEKYGSTPPTKEEAGEFLIKRFPRMDGGVSIAIGVAGLIIAGWQLWIAQKQEREARQSGIGGGKKCPHCSKDDIKKNKKAGKFVCKHGYRI